MWSAAPELFLKSRQTSREPREGEDAGMEGGEDGRHPDKDGSGGEEEVVTLLVLMLAMRKKKRKKSAAGAAAVRQWRECDPRPLGRIARTYMPQLPPRASEQD